MNVIFISLCEKKAKNKTRRVLDAYAIRAGVGTWLTPITQESLSVVWRDLKKVATRQTSVACYKTLGNKRMKLLWIVGSRKNFTANGATPIATKTRKPSQLNIDTRLLQLCHTGGLTHDLGKATSLFQAKLSSELPSQDPVRHEWVSGVLLTRMIDENVGVAEALDELEWNQGRELRGSPKFNQRTSLVTLLDTLKFAVVTHHGLPGDKESDSFTTDTYFKGWHSPKHNDDKFKNNPQKYFCSGGDFPESLSDKIAKDLRQISKEEISHSFCRALALLSRAFLIVADHIVSSRAVIPEPGLLANTRKDNHGDRVRNQPLNYHLENVGYMANKLAYHTFTHSWEGITDATKEHILLEAPDGSRFAWQDRATRALNNLRKRTTGPRLVMNIAGTGAGKTRMNAKAICVLNEREQVRFSTALGLKNLTLQTGDAYSEELNIPRTHLSCVIGDRVAKKLHESKVPHDAAPNDDENDDETVFEAVFSSPIDLPSWLEEYGNMEPSARKLLAPPVLVSTVDYLIAAGEPSKQGHHALALQRLINSDLILDEIDDYSPKSFVAILRLVEMAAMVGANVVTSSATLPKPMVRYLAAAFLNGARMNAELYGRENKTGIAIISDYIDPLTEVINSAEEAYERYRSYIQEMIPVMERKQTKNAKIAAIPMKSEQGFLEVVERSVKELHSTNSWNLKSADKKVSFGLVRIANIKNIHVIARHLAESIPNALVASYHADDFTIQRHRKEKILDDILSRKSGNNNIENCGYIYELCKNFPSEEVIFILVASPVEEVGRDHDFDWAVIEPSSVRSIIQTAGRVNRHRLIEALLPNIHILEYGMSCCIEGGCDKFKHYHRPGFESKDEPLTSHSMNDLICSENLSVLTARLRFSDNEWAKNEDKVIENEIRRPIRDLTLSGKKKTAWMSKGFYMRYPLRDHSNDTVYVWKDGQWFEEITNETYSREYVSRPDVFKSLDSPKNTWLCWSLPELSDYCGEVGIDVTAGLRVTLDLRFHDAQPKVGFSKSFGFDKTKRD